jgi:hypothetical protein
MRKFGFTNTLIGSPGGLSPIIGGYVRTAGSCAWDVKEELTVIAAIRARENWSLRVPGGNAVRCLFFRAQPHEERRGHAHRGFEIDVTDLFLRAGIGPGKEKHPNMPILGGNGRGDVWVGYGVLCFSFHAEREELTTNRFVALLWRGFARFAPGEEQNP